MRPTTSLPAAALTGALLLAACGGGDGTTETDTGTATGAATPDEATAAAFDLVQEGSLTVCSDVPYAPFEMEDPQAPSGYTGFDIELMQEIAERLELELRVVDTGFDAIQSGQALAAGQCDIAASAMTITEEREENVDFTEPYFNADQSLLVRAEDADTYQSLEDLAGQAIGVQADTTGQAYAEENAPEDATVRAYPDAAALFNALEAGEIAAILQDLPVNVERAQQDESVEVTATFSTGERYGFAVREEGSEALLEAVNDALAGLREESTYDQLYEKYFGEAPQEQAS